MKLFINHFDKTIFEKKLYSVKHIDFSLFIDYLPQNNNDLSQINIIVLQEPNEYFGYHDWVINNNIFDIILTWDDKVLNKCSNSLFLPFGHTWFKSDQYNKQHLKEFNLSHLRGNLLKSYGHQLRWELLDRKDELNIPITFFESYGDRYDIEDARIGKEKVFSNSMFGVAIENFSHRGYFTEKILDCFLLKTIPVYWGCSNIEDYFDIEGIILFNNVDDLIYKVNQLDEQYYLSKKEIIEKNWKLALNYVNYEQNIVNTITHLFKYNNLV
jgi:hypothetical protein